MGDMHLLCEHNTAAAAHVDPVTMVENLEKWQCFDMAPGFLFLDLTEDPFEVIL